MEVSLAKTSNSILQKFNEIGGKLHRYVQYEQVMLHTPLLRTCACCSLPNYLNLQR